MAEARDDSPGATGEGANGTGPTGTGATARTGDGARGFPGQVRDAVSTRSALVMLGVLLLQLGFALSYMGAFHAPEPHKVPITLVAPSAVERDLVARLDALPGDPLQVTPVESRAQARARLLDRRTDAALVVDPASRADTLIVASAGGPSATTAAVEILQKVARAQDRTIVVRDIRPPAAGDSRGLSSFYIVLSWTIGGYLAASALNMAAGSKKPTLRRTLVRLAAMLPYGFVSGIGGAIIVGPVLDCLPGAFWELVGIGTLVVFASGAVGVALQSVAGTVGLGLTILIFTILGNPSSGGVYPASLLPPFWSAIGQALPPGAGTTVVRNTVYFDGNATTGALWILGAWAFGGIVVAVLAAALRASRTTRKTPPARPAAPAL
ncbi:ABC transporter permease [Streptomyces californicus]|uniref:ABC transporter permease n=1 Tax=Streptomyces californicus TaxID=67351 RepID=UPI00378A9ACD